jgi:hypothetical protein
MCAIVPGGQRNTPLGIPQSTPPPAAHVKSPPQGERNTPLEIPQTPSGWAWWRLIGTGSHCLTTPHRYSCRSESRRSRASPAPTPSSPPWGICNTHQIKCVHWGHHFRATVPCVGACCFGNTPCEIPQTEEFGVFRAEIPPKGPRIHQKWEYTKKIHRVFPTGI